MLVALALGAEAPRRRVIAAHRMGCRMVICQAAPGSARGVLRRIGRSDLATSIVATTGNLPLACEPGLAGRVLPAQLTPVRFRELLAGHGTRLSARELAAGYQVLELALAGVRDVLSADDGNLGALRAALARIEPFTFFGTGTLASRDGVAALSMTAAAPRGIFLASPASKG
jgi:hypothetical protein